MTTTTQRGQVRAAVLALVKAALPGVSVKLARRADGDSDQVFIYMADGDVGYEAFDGRNDAAELVIEASTEEISDPDGVLDALMEPVEQAMIDDRQLGGLIHGHTLQRWRYSSEDDASRTSLVLVYQIEFS